MRLTKIIRVSIGVLLLIILVIIFGNFITRSKKRPKISEKSENIIQQKIEMKEQIEHFEVEGEKGNFQVRADKHYIGEDNRYHAKGNVEIVFFKKREGKDVLLYGNEVVYDKNWNQFFLSGSARVKFEDIIIESNFFKYNTNTEVFRSDRGAKFSSEQLSGSAQRMIYLVKKERIELRQDIHLEIKLNLETSLPLIVKGRRLSYLRKIRQGTIEGGVHLFQGESHALAETVKFELFENEEQIKSLILTGKVKASLIEKDKTKVSLPNKTSLFAHSTKREIEADRLELKGFTGLAGVQTIDAGGNGSFKFISSSGSFTHVQAESIKFVLDPEGELREFYASKGARITKQEEAHEERRIIEGETMIIKGKTNILRVKGEGKLKAKVFSKHSEIFADEIELFLDNSNLEAKGGVEIVLKTGGGEERALGFFSKEQPVFITAQEMRYSDEQKRFFFKEKIKMWQQKKMLLAEEITLNEETGEMLCMGGVKSSVPYKPKEKEEERIDISAHRMIFQPEKNVVTYKEESSLRVKNINLQSQSISVYLKEGMGDMENIIAQEKVNIVQNLREGRGERAIYDLDKETIVLLGNPVLIDRDKGLIRGDKLTFYIADGRIIVENKDRERSVTVIKS